MKQIEIKFNTIIYGNLILRQWFPLWFDTIKDNVGNKRMEHNYVFKKI